MSNICYSGKVSVGHYDTHHTRENMDAQFASKTSASISPFDPNFKIHLASFQAYKLNSEDRTAVLRTDYGGIVGVFDGHYDSFVSEYASKHLITEVDARISAVIAKHPNTLGDAIPICLVDTIQKFDATLHRTMIEKLCAMDSKPLSEWTKDDVPRFLGVKEMGENDPYPIMRRACAGSTDLWAQQIHTPPYISSTPSVMHFSIKRGDMLVFCSDGLRSSLTEPGVPDQDVGNMIVSLAGMDLLDAGALLAYEKAIGYSFIPSADVNNVADRVIRNVIIRSR